MLCCYLLCYLPFSYLGLTAKMLDVVMAVIEADVISILLLFKAMMEVLDVREPCFIDGSWCYRTMFCFGS